MKKDIVFKKADSNKERWERAVEALNESLSKLHLRPSEVNGIGVFTREDIKKGEKLYASDLPAALDLPLSYIKKLKPHLQQDILGMFPYVIKNKTKERRTFIYPPTAWVIYMNHSDNPNYDHIKDEALRDIKAGEEIFEDYRNLEDYKKIYKFIK